MSQAASAETISDDNATFSLRSFHGNSCNASLITTGPDQLCRLAWYYRLDDAGWEDRLVDPDRSSSQGNTARFDWTDLRGLGLVVSLRFELYGGTDDGSALLIQTLSVTNRTSAVRTIDVFAHMDADIGLDRRDDRGAELAANHSLAQFDDEHWSGHRGDGADAYAVVRNRGRDSLHSELGDRHETELDNAGLPFGPGDMEYAFQWSDRVLGAGETIEFRKISSFDRELPGFEPEPFEFEDQGALLPDKLVTSAAVRISMPRDMPHLPIRVRNGEYRQYTGTRWLPWTTHPGLIGNRSLVQLRHWSSLHPNTTHTTTVTIGTSSASWSTTTMQFTDAALAPGYAGDTQPDPFQFTDLNGVDRGVPVVSPPIQIMGIDRPVFAQTHGTGQLSVNGGPFTLGRRLVSAGDSVVLRHTTARRAQATVDTILWVGGITDTFSSTTR